MVAIIGFVAVGFFVFGVFVVAKQIQFYVQSVDLYRVMIKNQEKILEQLIKTANNTPEKQKIIAEANQLEAQGDQSAQAARKMRLSTISDRKACPKCYRDYSKYIMTCEVCDCDLKLCQDLL